MKKGFDPYFHLGAWSKPNSTARRYCSGLPFDLAIVVRFARRSTYHC
ncbi:hypothetical protein [Marinomonas primoryensis]